MNKGYAFGFLIVLLVLILGFYVAYTGFVSSREALRAQPTSAGSSDLVQLPTPNLPTPLPTITATLVLTPTSASEITAALTVELAASPASTGAAAGPPPSTNPPPPTPAAPPSAQQTDVPAEVVPPPTPAPLPAQQFRLAGPPSADPDYPICCYIYGTVRDAAGNGLEGIQVQALNEWTPPVTAFTKGGGEVGKYDIPINTAVENWDVVLVDPAGNQISSKVRIQFDENVAQGYRVDWHQTY
jgi:hypothetical protein